MNSVHHTIVSILGLDQHHGNKIPAHTTSQMGNQPYDVVVKGKAVHPKPVV